MLYIDENRNVHNVYNYVITRYYILYYGIIIISGN